MKLNYLLLLLACLFHQATCIQYSLEIGKAFSLVALALAVFHHPFFKSHLRMLDLLQLCYLFSLTATITPTFSLMHSWSWAQFIPNFWHLLSLGPNNYLNTSGYLLSFGSCLFVAIIISWIVTLIVRGARRTTWKFSEVFNLFKGLIRWVYLGLVYTSVKKIIATCQITDVNVWNTVFLEDLIAPAVVLFVCLLYPIWQVIQRAVADGREPPQDQNGKWVEFLSLFRLLLVGAFYAMSQDLHWFVFIGIYVMDVIYAITVLVLNKWDNVVERIIFALTEAVIIAIFSLINFGLNVTMWEKDIDFYLITIAFGLEVIYEIYKYIRLAQVGRHQRKVDNFEGPSIVPFESKDELQGPEYTEVEMRLKAKNGSDPNLTSKKTLPRNTVEDTPPTSNRRMNDLGTKRRG